MKINSDIKKYSNVVEYKYLKYLREETFSEKNSVYVDSKSLPISIEHRITWRIWIDNDWRFLNDYYEHVPVDELESEFQKIKNQKERAEKLKKIGKS